MKVYGLYVVKLAVMLVLVCALAQYFGPFSRIDRLGVSNGLILRDPKYAESRTCCSWAILELACCLWRDCVVP
jgi:hypothetical protein